MDGARGLIEVLAELAIGIADQGIERRILGRGAVSRKARRGSGRRAGKTPEHSTPIGPGAGCSSWIGAPARSSTGSFATCPLTFILATVWY